MINVNTSNIGNLYVGQTEVERVYLGTEIVYEKEVRALKIKSLEDNSIIGLAKKFTYHTLEYSLDGVNWSDFDSGATFQLNSGECLYVRGIIPSYPTQGQYNYTNFSMSGKFSVSGNCNYLWNYNNVNDELVSYCGYKLFYNCTSLIDSSNLILPSKTLSPNCYREMFEDCTSLVDAPKLPATTLAQNCYDCMFLNCTSLTTAPELPATALMQSCYNQMFRNCISLTEAPELPATTLTSSDNYCYSNMFAGCTGLVSAPELPATELSVQCYGSMFEGCTSLVHAPELPATVLENYCYIAMFRGCTSLVRAPKLPATTLANSCYWGMFSGCTNLNYIECLATDMSEGGCTTNWVSGVQTNSGTFIKNQNMSDWEFGNNGIPNNWNVEDAVIE